MLNVNVERATRWAHKKLPDFGVMTCNVPTARYTHAAINTRTDVYDVKKRHCDIVTLLIPLLTLMARTISGSKRKGSIIYCINKSSNRELRLKV